MPGFYTHTDTGTEWKSFAFVNAHSIEMTFAEADKLLSITIPKVKSDVQNEGCENAEIELSQCKPVSG